ncbi:MAG: nitroreductase family protein [Clostridiales bacterium]|nr:nitroreductase family protein [Clostridiales bacterium]
MEAYEAIMTRTSVRSYLDRPIGDAEVRKILEAGMSGPSCANRRDWSFVVVRDREMLNRMADANGRPAAPLRKAALGILVCGDLQKAFQPAPDYWIIDGAIAAQNMILAAHALGIGAVWLGTYPQMERVRGQAALLNLPEHIVPHSVLAFGYPDPAEDGPAREKAYEADCVHFETW